MASRLGAPGSSKPVEVAAPWVPRASIVEPEEWPANEPIPAKRRCGFCEWVRRWFILLAALYIGGGIAVTVLADLAANGAGGDGFSGFINGAGAGLLVCFVGCCLLSGAVSLVDDLCAPGAPGW
jgi:hypothetical protein